MDPRIKEAKLKSIWTECTAVTDPDDIEWILYFCEVTLENKERLSSASDLLNVMKSELDNLSTGPDDKTKLEICTNVWEKIKKPEPTAKQEKPTGPPEKIPVSLGKLSNVFKKEIAKRKHGEPELTAEILNCVPHDFFYAVSHGERCQICDFETTKDIWCCRKNCGVSLCGSCSFKWKNKC